MAEIAVRRADTNLEMLARVAERLGPLREEVVFLGGCTTGLLLTDSAAPDVRPTTDVDLIVEAGLTHDYHDVEASMRALGFQPDVESGIRCRWLVDGLLVDLMPTDETILGFSNRWYPDAIEHAVTETLSNSLEIRRVTAPYFIATKIEAFVGRGENDFVASHDFEDIVTVIDGRLELLEEVGRESEELRHFISFIFRQWLEDRDFQAAIPGHLPPDTVLQDRLPILMNRIRQLAGEPRT